MRKRILIWLGSMLLQAALIPAQATAGTNNYILRTSTGTNAAIVCSRYGLQIVRNLGQADVYLVQGSDSVPPDILQQWMKGDPDVKHIEPDDDTNVPEKSLVINPSPAGMPLTTAITDRDLIKLYGATAWAGYVQQPAMGLINAFLAQKRSTGTGIVAIIDTGVDPRHPLLSPVLVTGYDFTRNVEGAASEWNDLNQSTAAILQQSTAAILEKLSVVQLNQSTAAILEQSTAAILQGKKPPAYFGHGTMVAGLVHLVAPTAKIMPLKAFTADGTSNMFDIERAIYYAVDHGAKVINMSFSVAAASDELTQAIDYATQHGVICLGSAGNSGRSALVFPAAFRNVIGIASTTMTDQRSSFSNYGDHMVRFAAPGEALITLYPGQRYASVSGTSFSTPLASG